MGELVMILFWAVIYVVATYRITLNDVSIRDMYGDQLQALLKTQSDREIAKQQETTYGQQQKAEEERQKLNKAEQAAVEEKTLATASYEALREEQRKKQTITIAEGAAEQVRIAAQAEADKITIQAKANADAIALKGAAEAERYSKIVHALGPQNATAIEVVDRVKGEIGKVTLPQLLVIGNGGSESAVGARLLQLLSPQAETPTAP